MSSAYTLLGSRLRGFRASVGSALPAAVTLIVLCVAGFAALVALLDTGALVNLDAGILLWMDSLASTALDGVALEVTSLGSAWVVWAIVLAVSLLLREIGDRYSAALLWIAFCGGVALNSLLKELFGRTRPDLFEWRTPYAGHFSFPSGHSMTAMVVYATLALVLWRHVSRGWSRILVLGGFGLVILMVGASRVYLGVHFPSDVLGAYLAGTAWATLCALGVEYVRYGRREDGVEPADRR